MRVRPLRWRWRLKLSCYFGGLLMKRLATALFALLTLLTLTSQAIAKAEDILVNWGRDYEYCAYFRDDTDVNVFYNTSTCSAIAINTDMTAQKLPLAGTGWASETLDDTSFAASGASCCITVDDVELEGAELKIQTIDAAIASKVDRLITTGRPDGQAQSVTGTTIRLAASESYADDELNDGTIVCIVKADTGAGQCRDITDYASGTDTATVPTWTTTPTGTIWYSLIKTNEPPAATAIATAVETELGTGSTFTAIPWNSAWDAEAQSEVADALAVYDPPTNAELEARTLVAANYFDPAADTVATVTNLTNLPSIPANWLTAAGTAADFQAEVQSEANDALVAYDPPTKAELDAAQANVSVDEIQATALADLFNTDSGTTYASAVAGSVVKETADNAGGASITVQQIVDGVLDEAISGHTDSGSVGEAISQGGDGGSSSVGSYVLAANAEVFSGAIAAVVSNSAQTSVQLKEKFVAGYARLDSNYVSGTGTTSVVVLEHSPDNSNWSTLATFASVGTSDSIESIEINDPVYRFVRAKVTTTGTSPSYVLGLDIWGYIR